jgi:hypothetical protein
MMEQRRAMRNGSDKKVSRHTYEPLTQVKPS